MIPVPGQGRSVEGLRHQLRRLRRVGDIGQVDGADPGVHHLADRPRDRRIRFVGPGSGRWRRGCRSPISPPAGRLRAGRPGIPQCLASDRRIGERRRSDCPATPHIVTRRSGHILVCRRGGRDQRPTHSRSWNRQISKRRCRDERFAARAPTALRQGLGPLGAGTNATDRVLYPARLRLTSPGSGDRRGRAQRPGRLLRGRRARRGVSGGETFGPSGGQVMGRGWGGCLDRC